MKLISWNVNGIRAVIRKNNWSDIFECDPDILCIQETKSKPEQLSAEAKPQGYHHYFASSEVKKGYSGVAIYSKFEPDRVEVGMDIQEFDEEGRMLGLFFDRLAVFNVYFPNGGQGPHRIEYKLRFYDAFLEYIELWRSKGFSVIFCGDVNTAHEEIDLARPKENQENTGFLPDERAWLDEVVNLGYIDTFRYHYPQKKDSYTYWDLKSRARDRNVGWRIDYVFVSPDLVQSLKNSFILSDVFGSDHCPIGVDLDITI